ncbi:hypothetical protein SAPIO_CDS9822 [Scedosporium apiospermum]|uniref:YCII-related domain-containing protein n=1 Tax=Pseudallescheria apiosperma TaxID=563466 RepID=A0A084FVQ5_PSEDA|nr:uncharacterized protein SAPIO_CDS9822 [Scedosporium apiospermum]KEZ39167.1 hypothetical protein SAPIO_CDS9822 [Scedosporium apiospermum]
MALTAWTRRRRHQQQLDSSKILADAGVVRDIAGLHNSSKGVRITFGTAGTSTVANGPFPHETVVSGYWIFETKDLQEAISWAQKAPFPEGGVLEVRQIAQLEDFGEEFAEKLKAAREDANKMSARD